MNNPNTARYLILRPCLWFAKGEMVEVDKFQSYYTTKAVKSLLDYNYIQIIL
jgi:hypothetical protein